MTRTTPLFPSLSPQEIPLDDPKSSFLFQPTSQKPFVATPAAIDTYGLPIIIACLRLLPQGWLSVLFIAAGEAAATW